MIRSLISEIKEFKKPSILASLFMVFEVMFEISIPFVMASLLDQGVLQRNMQNILFYGGLMLVCAFCSLFCGMQSARYGAYASAGFAKNLRRAIFKKVQTFSFENIDQFSSGGLVTRMMTDVTNVQNSYQMIIRMCAGSAQFDLCHCGLFYDQCRDGYDLCLCDHLFGSSPQHHHEDCVSALY